MKSKNKALFTAFLAIMALFLSSISPAASDVVKIVGEVNDANQIVADGEIFEVDDTPAGNDLVANYISQKVEVTGKLRVEGDMRVIAVIKFRTVEE